LILQEIFSAKTFLDFWKVWRRRAQGCLKGFLQGRKALIGEVK
jgi:hypothetical protein